MAKFTAITALRVALALGLSTLAACGSPSKFMATDPDKAPSLGAANVTDQYTAVIPFEQFQVDKEAPERYEVVKGDTLWDISDRFLEHAWLWPQVWDYNPQIPNPHLIYPGDMISLEYVNGVPRMVIERDGTIISRSGSGTERLSPRIRTESLADAIPMISGEAISSFLVHPRVVSLSEIRNAPRIVGNFEGRLISAAGHKVFAKGELRREQPAYGVFRRTKTLRDPQTRKTLGYEVQHVSDVRLTHLGDPSTLVITDNKMETINGDILLTPNDEKVVQSYKTRIPSLGGGTGRIISLVNSISQTGRNQVVVLNLGADNSIREGDILAIESNGQRLIDPRGKRSKVKLPTNRTGVVMVFKVFDDVSYALVMESTLPVRVNDEITGI